MATFCKTCIAPCCNHCKHYRDDELVGEKRDDGFTGTCMLHGWRVEPLYECNDFFCAAAEREGFGFAEAAGSRKLPGFRLEP